MNNIYNNIYNKKAMLGVKWLSCLVLAPPLQLRALPLLLRALPLLLRALPLLLRALPLLLLAALLLLLAALLLLLVVPLLLQAPPLSQPPDPLLLLQLVAQLQVQLVQLLAMGKYFHAKLIMIDNKVINTPKHTGIDNDLHQYCKGCPAC
jgi:hypothetical protein